MAGPLVETIMYNSRIYTETEITDTSRNTILAEMNFWRTFGRTCKHEDISGRMFRARVGWGPAASRMLTHHLTSWLTVRPCCLSHTHRSPVQQFLPSSPAAATYTRTEMRYIGDGFIAYQSASLDFGSCKNIKVLRFILWRSVRTEVSSPGGSIHMTLWRAYVFKPRQLFLSALSKWCSSEAFSRGPNNILQETGSSSCRACILASK